MTYRTALAALAALALAACATAAPAPLSPSWYVMRHLQKADGPDPGLTEKGRRNAAGLATLLATMARPGHRPAAIYVSNTRRARETAAPLAQRLGIQPTVYEAADIAGLVASVVRERGPVLIVGHSNTVPEIIERLGGTRPAAIPETRFGDIWVISGPTGQTTRIRPFP